MSLFPLIPKRPASNDTTEKIRPRRLVARKSRTSLPRLVKKNRPRGFLVGDRLN